MPINQAPPQQRKEKRSPLESFATAIGIAGDTLETIRGFKTPKSPSLPSPKGPELDKRPPDLFPKLDKKPFYNGPKA